MRRRASAFVVGLTLVLTAILPVAGGNAGPGRQRWRECGVWTKIPVPDPNSGVLRDVVVVSPTDAWAVGALGAEEFLEPIVLRWTGQRWERIGFPRLDGNPMTATLNAVAVAGDGTVWAVGGRSTGRGSLRPLTARYTGGRWHVVPIAAREIRGSLQGLSAVPGTNALWAVGHMFEPRSAALTLRWNGERWRRFRVPVSARGNVDSLADVVAFRRTAWAVGTTTPDGNNSFMFAARWHDDGWHALTGPRGVALGVDGLRPDELVAAGWRPAERDLSTGPPCSGGRATAGGACTPTTAAASCVTSCIRRRAWRGRSDRSGAARSSCGWAAADGTVRRRPTWPGGSRRSTARRTTSGRCTPGATGRARRRSSARSTVAEGRSATTRTRGERPRASRRWSRAGGARLSR